MEGSRQHGFFFNLDLDTGGGGAVLMDWERASEMGMNDKSEAEEDRIG